MLTYYGISALNYSNEVKKLQVILQAPPSHKSYPSSIPFQPCYHQLQLLSFPLKLSPQKQATSQSIQPPLLLFFMPFIKLRTPSHRSPKLHLLYGSRMALAAPAWLATFSSLALGMLHLIRLSALKSLPLNGIQV